MQGFILTAFTAAEKCTLFLDLTLILTKSEEHEMKVNYSRAPGHGAFLKSASRTITVQGFILPAFTAVEIFFSRLDINFYKVSRA